MLRHIHMSFSIWIFNFQRPITFFCCALRHIVRLIKSCSDTPLCARMIFAQRYEDRRRLQPEDDSNTDPNYPPKDNHLLDYAQDHPIYREGRPRQLVTLCHQRMYHYAGTYPLRYLQLIATDTVIDAMQIASLRI